MGDQPGDADWRRRGRCAKQSPYLRKPRPLWEESVEKLILED